MVLLAEMDLKLVMGGTTNRLDVTVNFQVPQNESALFANLLVSYLTGSLDAVSLANALLVDPSQYDLIRIQNVIIKPV